jgi:heptaprenyl diphosphate synthase
MSTTSRAKARTARLCRNAVFLALAMILSFLEHLVPIAALIPLPGVKLGLANVAITVLLFFGSPWDALLVSLCRIGLSALLFGTPISFLFSLCGGLLSFAVLLVCRYAAARFLSFIGVCVLSATGHHVGQMVAAVVLFDSGVLLTYLPVLLLAGVVLGGVTGMILNLTESRLRKLFGRL